MPASRSVTPVARWAWSSTPSATTPARLSGRSATRSRWPALTIAAWKLAPALAAGNTVVLKPAELTPLTALQFERIALEAGIPEGVVNVVVGPGSSCGARLVEHPDVAKVAFTGSTEVGRSIAAGAAQTIKRVTLELGGKSANVVFADADLEAAAAAAPGSVFGNAGQDCCARSTRSWTPSRSTSRASAWATRSTRPPRWGR
jgi:acyl-CoA reductase-like NAD-dependent aldehyde dehydrogenase